MTRTLLLISYEYINQQSLMHHLSSDVHYLVASKFGLGHILLKNPEGLDVESFKWQPAYSIAKLDMSFDSALLFWDGSDPLLKTSVDLFSSHSIPFHIIGPDAKEVAPTQFYATFSNGDHKMAQALAQQSKPQVIVDPPKPSPTYGQSDVASSSTHVRVLIKIPESIYAQYEEQAKLVSHPVEELLSDRLRTCVDHTSGRSLYFTDEQRSHLERLTGGHIIMNAEAALQKIHTTVNLKVGDIEIEMTERVLARCASRAKSQRQTLEQFVRKEVIMGLERVTGLRPW